MQFLSKQLELEPNRQARVPEISLALHPSPTNPLKTKSPGKSEYCIFVKRSLDREEKAFFLPCPVNSNILAVILKYTVKPTAYLNCYSF